MAATLDYERPLYTEHRVMPRGVRRLLDAIILTLVLLAVVMVAVATPRMGVRQARMMTIGPSIGLIALFLGRTARSTTQLYADSLRINFFMAGFPIWRRRVPWATLVRCDLLDHKEGVGFKAIGLGLSQTMVMFGGRGVRLILEGSKELLVGTNQPRELFEAIESARTAQLTSDTHSAA